MLLAFGSGTRVRERGEDLDLGCVRVPAPHFSAVSDAEDDQKAAACRKSAFLAEYPFRRATELRSVAAGTDKPLCWLDPIDRQIHPVDVVRRLAAI